MKPFVLKRDDLIFLHRLIYKMRNPPTKFDEKAFIKKGRDYLFKYAEDNVGPLSPERRMFLKGLLIGIGALAVVSVLPVLGYLNQPEITLKDFPWMIVTDSNGNPIEASKLPVNNPAILVFQYPMQGDITFLINIGDKNGNPVAVPSTTVTIPENGATYTFPGGVGPNKSIVAYSAICQHLGCIPPEIHYYPPNLVQPNGPFPNYIPSDVYNIIVSQGINYGVIHCDCHGSTYDPYKGASVVTGPTVRPLPYVQLYWDPNTDYLYAVGMNPNAPVILGRSNDLSGFATLSSYDENTECSKLLLQKGQTPTNCYTRLLTSFGNPFQQQG